MVGMMVVMMMTMKMVMMVGMLLANLPFCLPARLQHRLPHLRDHVLVGLGQLVLLRLRLHVLLRPGQLVLLRHRRLHFTSQLILPPLHRHLLWAAHHNSGQLLHTASALLARLAADENSRNPLFPLAPHTTLALTLHFASDPKLLNSRPWISAGGFFHCWPR